MNRYQAVRRIKTILTSLRWGGTGDPVFGRDSVYVTVAPLESRMSQLVMPAAFVRPGSARVDPERPGLLMQDIAVTVIVSVPGDQLGERPLIGSNRTGKTSWGGRGLLEVESEMLGAIAELDASGQMRMQHRATSVLGALAGESGYHNWCEYGFEAMLSTGLQCPEPRGLALSESGGTVTLTWEAPDDTTGLVSYVVRRASGSLPVAYPDSGTSVPWSSGTSTTDVPGSGTWTYSVFAAYDEDGGAVALDHSDCDWESLEVA